MALYDIRVTGHLDRRWNEWFDGLTITNEESAVTLLSGEIVDQAALHGTLNKIRNLNLPLISVTNVTVVGPTVTPAGRHLDDAAEIPTSERGEP